MVKEFQEALGEIYASDDYVDFLKEHKSYNLAHGFLQLDANMLQLKEWQIGFYSKENDNLAVYDTNPIKRLAFEDAFKDGGHIDELKEPKSFISTAKALQIFKDILDEKHSHEISNSFLMIVQIINQVPVYNITAITAAFSMISTHINALSGEIIKENKSSILDLKKNK